MYFIIRLLPSCADPAQIVIAPESSSVDVGVTVLITCVAYGELPTNITWVRDSDQTTLDNSTSPRVTIYEELVTEGGLTFTQSILEVCSVEEMDASNYTCFTANDFGNDTATFELAVNPQGKASETGKQLPPLTLTLLFHRVRCDHCNRSRGCHCGNWQYCADHMCGIL